MLIEIARIYVYILWFHINFLKRRFLIVVVVASAAPTRPKDNLSKVYILRSFDSYSLNTFAEVVLDSKISQLMVTARLHRFIFLSLRACSTFTYSFLSQELLKRVREDNSMAKVTFFHKAHSLTYAHHGYQGYF